MGKFKKKLQSYFLFFLTLVQPRLEGTVEIRSPSLTVLQISQVYVALYRTDTINVPSARPAGMAGVIKRDKSYLIGEKIKLFQASTFPASGGELVTNGTTGSSQLSSSSSASSNSTANKRYDEVLGLDLNFLLPLPITKQLPASISLQKRAVETSYQLFVTVIYGKQLLTLHQPFPVRIKRYDKLSTYGQFHVPLKGNIVSPDHLVEFEYSIPQSSFGPRDSIVSYVKILPNPDLGAKSRKIKLQRLSVQVVEVITFNTSEVSSASFMSSSSSTSISSGAGGLSSNALSHTISTTSSASLSTINSHSSFSQDSSSGDGPIERRRKLCKATNQLDIKLPESGYRCEITMDFPTTDLREPREVSGALVPQTRTDIPLIANNSGFTTAAPLYRVDYLLVFKAKFSHSKDILIEQPITVTPFDHVMCASLMKAIKIAVEEANEAYQDREEYVLNSSAPGSRKQGPNGAQSSSYIVLDKKTGETKKVFVPTVYRPNDTNSYTAYGVQPTGVGLLGGAAKPILIIR